MAKKEAERLIYEMHAEVCSVLANPKRLEIINLLRKGEKATGELADQMGISKANASQQLAILRDKGILKARRDGQRVRYRLAYPKMIRAYDLLRQILIDRLREQGTAADRVSGGKE